MGINKQKQIYCQIDITYLNIYDMLSMIKCEEKKNFQNRHTSMCDDKHIIILYSLVFFMNYRLWQLTTTFSFLSFLIMCLYVLSSVLYCLIMCLYVLSSVLWCQLRFPHKNDVRFAFTSGCL